MKRATLVFAEIGFAFVLASCAIRPGVTPAPPPLKGAPEERDLLRVDPNALGEMFDDLSPESLISAIGRDLEYLSRLSPERMIRMGDTECSIACLRKALEELRTAAASGASLDTHVRERFRFYRSAGRAGGALFTGYYEPVLQGRRRRREPFVYPLYRRPDDLSEPYYSRREIDGEGTLEGRNLELVWLADPVARFFLQIQGSGVIVLEDGSQMRVGFAGSNGRKYTSVGRILVDSGRLRPEEASAPAIQRILREQPDEAASILFANERYVFFREVEDGPMGSTGVKLTAGRSIAADPAHYPLGALAYIRTRLPIARAGLVSPAARPIRRFVLHQDTGGAILGPGRVDLFFGTGDEAGREAGTMSAKGELYVLVPECDGSRDVELSPTSRRDSYRSGRSTGASRAAH